MPPRPPIPPRTSTAPCPVHHTRTLSTRLRHTLTLPPTPTPHPYTIATPKIRYSHPPSPRLLAYPRARSFQVYALQEESFRAHALLREIDGDGPSRAVEAVVAAKEATLLKELVSPDPRTLTLTLP